MHSQLLTNVFDKNIILIFQFFLLLGENDRVQ